MILESNDNTELDELYQDVILDHFKRPRHKHTLNDCVVCQPGKNPLCGDELELYLKQQDDGALSLSFEGHGCSISQASASIMTEAVNGLKPAEAQKLIEDFESRIRGQVVVDPDDPSFRDIDALSSISKFPVRIKCASLAWKALELALKELEEKKKV